MASDALLVSVHLPQVSATTTASAHFTDRLAICKQLEADSNSANSTWEVLLFNSALTRHSATVSIASRKEPDYSVSSTISSVLMFLPGSTAGITAFLIFGTIEPFRKVYRESMRECCSSCCWGKRRISPSNTDDLESGRGWRALGAGSGRAPTYRCRVESVCLGRVDLTGIRDGKKDGVVREYTVPKTPDKVEQPWRTLGITPIQK